MVYSDGLSRPRAHVHTAATIPALIREHDDGRLSLRWVWVKHIHLAGQTFITSVTDIGVKYYRPMRGRWVGKGIYFFFNLTHLDTPPLFINMTNIILVTSIIVLW